MSSSITTSKKTYQLALPPESPDQTHKKAKEKTTSSELKVVSNTKHMSINKKESLDSLKKYQSDMKRQKLDNENKENVEALAAATEKPTVAGKKEGKKDDTPKKSPYEVLFEQNQRLVQELEVC
jgi:hypothetical protein